MKVSQLIKNKHVVTISASKNVSELVQLLNENRIGAVVVSENGSDIVGIVSERDIVKKLNENSNVISLKVADLMTVDVQRCTKDDSVAAVMKQMTDGKFRHLPVVDENNKLESIVSIGDVVKARITEIDDEISALSSYIQN